MKNEKGFTLVELMGIATLLGVIALIAFPAVKDLIYDSRQKLYEEQKIQIENGLKNWANYNIFMLPENNGTVTLSLGQLKQMGYAEIKIRNPKNDKCFSNESLLKIIKENGIYSYSADELVDVDCSLLEDAPIITLNGNMIEYLNVGDAYAELGANAKSSNGTNLTSNIIKTINEGETIDTSTEGTYTITYSITDDEKTAIAIRTIFVS